MDECDVKGNSFGISPALAARENSPLPVFVVDAQGNCVYVNARYCQLYEMSRERALALGWLDRVHPEDRARVIELRHGALTSIGSFHVEYRIVSSRGSTLWIASTSTPLLDDQGKFIGRTGIVTQMLPPRRSNEE